MLNEDGDAFEFAAAVADDAERTALLKYLIYIILLFQFICKGYILQIITDKMIVNNNFCVLTWRCSVSRYLVGCHQEDDVFLAISD